MYVVSPFIKFTLLQSGQCFSIFILKDINIVAVMM